MTDLPPVTDDRWDAEVIDADGDVVVVLVAPGSSPCQAFDPILDGLAEALLGTAKVLALDVEENVVTARRYDVSSLPTLLVFRRGRLVGRLVGARSRERLLSALSTYLA